MNNIEFCYASTYNRLTCYFCLLLGIWLTQPAQAQKKLHVDLKSGFTFARFQGPSEHFSSPRDLERFRFNTGVHLALGVGYALTPNSGLQAELQYAQAGTQYEFNGISYWFLPSRSGEVVYSFGTRNMELDVVNTYLALPLLFYAHSNRIELSVGAGVGYLLSSQATGRLAYSGLTESGARITPFTIDLRFDYLNDSFERLPLLGDRTRTVGGQPLEIPRVIGAYYESTGEEVHRFRQWDVQLFGSISFFLSQELFVGFRMSYGLSDITNNRQDASIVQVATDRSLIFTRDMDRNLVFYASVGLRF